MKGLVTKAAVVGLSLALAGCVGMTRSELEQSKIRTAFDTNQSWKTTYNNIKRGYRECWGLDPTLLSPSHKIATDEYDEQNKGVITWYNVGPYGGHKIISEVIITKSSNKSSHVQFISNSKRGLPIWKKRLERWATGDMTCD